MHLPLRRRHAGLLGPLALLAGCATGVLPPERPRLGSVAVAGAGNCQPAGEAADPALAWCQVSRDAEGLHVSGVVGAGPMAEALPQAYAALARVLAAQGRGLGEVARETLYTTDLKGLDAQRDRRRTVYADQPPAVLVVEVKQLYLPSQVLEIEVTLPAR